MSARGDSGAPAGETCEAMETECGITFAYFASVPDRSSPPLARPPLPPPSFICMRLPVLLPAHHPPTIFASSPRADRCLPGVGASSPTCSEPTSARQPAQPSSLGSSTLASALCSWLQSLLSVGCASVVSHTRILPRSGGAMDCAHGWRSGGRGLAAFARSGRALGTFSHCTAHWPTPILFVCRPCSASQRSVFNETFQLPPCLGTT